MPSSLEVLRDVETQLQSGTAFKILIADFSGARRLSVNTRVHYSEPYFYFLLSNSERRKFLSELANEILSLERADKK